MAIDDHVTRLAELRNNLLRVSDLQLLGLSRRQIRARIARRRFFAVHPGVLSRTPPPFDFTTRAAALSLALPLGVLSHTTAASLHRIRRAPRDWLDVTLPSRRAR